MRPLREMVSEPEPLQHTKDDVGAFAFVSYYTDLQEWAEATANPDLLSSVCLPENEQCAVVRKGVQELRDRGGRNTLNMMSYFTVGGEGDTKTVMIGLQIEPTEIVDSSGAVIGGAGSYDMRVTYEMRWVDSRWMMAKAARTN